MMAYHVTIWANADGTHFIGRPHTRTRAAQRQACHQMLLQGPETPAPIIRTWTVYANEPDPTEGRRSA